MANNSKTHMPLTKSLTFLTIDNKGDDFMKKYFMKKSKILILVLLTILTSYLLNTTESFDEDEENVLELKNMKSIIESI